MKLSTRLLTLIPFDVTSHPDDIMACRTVTSFGGVLPVACFGVVIEETSKRSQTKDPFVLPPLLHSPPTLSLTSAWNHLP